MNTTTEDANNIFVYDTNGKVVFEIISTTLPTVEINISNYPKGVYFLKVINDHEVWSEKIISQ